MKVSLHGSYFGDNFGDTLFCIMFKNAIEASNNDAEVFFPFASKRVRRFCDSKSPRIRDILLPEKIVYIGGGYLGEPTQSSKIWNIRLVIRHLLIMTYYMLIRRPYRFYSLGAGPLENVFIRKWVKIILNNSEGIYVRDRKSYEFLIGIGVQQRLLTLATDWVLNLTKDFSHNPKPLKIGIHLPSLALHEHYKLSIDQITEFVFQNKSSYEISYFKDFYKENFADASYEYLEQKGLSHEYVEYQSPNQLIEHISQLDVLISNKLHCCIVACAYGVCTLSIGVHEKTTRFFEQIEYGANNILLSEKFDNFISKGLSDFSKPVIPEHVTQSLIIMQNDLSAFVNRND